MSDYTKGTKGFDTTIYPVHANGTSGLLKRVEPLLTPAKLKSRYLKGIIERLPAGVTFSDEELKDRINLATNELELLLGVPVFAEQFREKPAFDYNLYKSFIHIRAQQGPIITIEDLAIVSANKQNIFRIPADWVETANFHERLINVIPLLAAYGVNTIEGAVGNAGIAFLTVLGGLGWVPAYWQITYTAGVCASAGQVPIPVNELIGCIATINLLSTVAPNNANTSVSLSQDGIGQSSSNPGPQIFVQRIQELEAKKQALIGQLKRVFSRKVFLSNI
jgi:hypothetical protein